MATRTNSVDAVSFYVSPARNLHVCSEKQAVSQATFGNVRPEDKTGERNTLATRLGSVPFNKLSCQ